MRADPRAVLLALCLAALPALAQSEAYTEVRGVEVRGRCPWPAQMDQGYMPFMLDIGNPTEERRSVFISARRNQDDDVQIETGVTLEPGERVRLELAAPAWTSANQWWPQAQYSIVAHVDGREGIVGYLGATDHAIGEMRAGVVASREVSDESTVEVWEELLSTEEVDAGSVWNGSGQETTYRPNLDLASVPFDLLPRRWESYTSLDVVVVDTRRGLPDPARLEPLLAWGRAGGDLVFAGADDAVELLNTLPAVAGWLEDRFVLEELEGGRVWRFGLGLLAVQVPDPEGSPVGFPGPAAQGLVQFLTERSPGDVPGPRMQAEDVPDIPGLGELPYRAFALLLVLFAIAIGPLNFLVVKRLGRPALLLLSIPGTALVTAVLLLAYGLLHQGIDVKSATNSVAMLDQRAHRATSAEAREVFVGLTPGGGLRPGPGTAVLPIEYSRRGGRSARYRIDESEGTRLSGGFLPARLPVDQVVLTERSARARLDLKRTEDGVRVTNGLDATVQALLITDPDGGGWWLEEDLAAGASASLQAWAGRDVGKADLDFLHVLHGRALSHAPSTYAALLGANPVADDCGLETTELNGQHVLFGVMDRAPEGWR